MKFNILFSVCALALGFGLGGIAGRATMAAGTAASATQVRLTSHDAAGRTRTALATLNTAKTGYWPPEPGASGYVLMVDYTTPELFCSGFGP